MDLKNIAFKWFDKIILLVALAFAAYAFTQLKPSIRAKDLEEQARDKIEVLKRKLNLFARYDHFDPDRKDAVTPGDDAYDLVNGGLAWEFYHHFLWMLAYERTLYDRNNGGRGKVPEAGRDLADDWRAQTVLQITF
jgi:hypothetical protein